MQKAVKFLAAGIGGLALCAMLLPATPARAQSPVFSTKPVHKMKKILFVVTSHDKKGSTGAPTGYYLGEVSHAWQVLKNAGYEIDFVSPQGGKAPVDGFNLDDAVNRAFWEDKVYRHKIENTLKPSEVDPAAYAAIYYAGGHGTMWDFPENEAIAAIATRIY